jgi:hypothetical protein
MSEIVLLPVVQRLAQMSPVAIFIPQDISATAVPPGERKFLRGLMEFNIEARYPRDAEKMRKICTKRFAEDILKRVRKWHRRLSAEIGS